MVIPIAAIEFHASAYLWGLAAVVLPLLAHLRGRRRFERVEFPAVGFLREAAQAAASRDRPVDLLLLLLRMLVIVFVACAFARPVWKQGASLSFGASAEPGGDVICVLDASASMQRKDGGTSLFAQAVSDIERTLGEIDKRIDRAAVIVAGGTRPISLLPRLTANVDALRDRLNAVEPTFGRAHLDRALDLAASLSADEASNADSAGARLPPRIIVWTDGQANEWPASLLTTSGSTAATRIETRIIGESAEDSNHAVVSIRTDPPQPIVGELFNVTVEVVSFDSERAAGGQASRAPITIDLNAFGRTWSAPIRWGESGGDERAVASFSVTGEEPGLHEMVASIRPGGALVSDDVLHGAVRLVPARTVALLTAAPTARQAEPDAPVLTTADLIASAIAPDEGSPYSVIIPEPGLWGTSTDDAHAVLVVGAARVDDDVIADLMRFINAGGSVLWIADSLASIESLGRLNRGLTSADARPTQRRETDVSRSLQAAHDEALRIRFRSDFSEPGIGASPPSTPVFSELGPAGRRAVESITFQYRSSRVLRSFDDIWMEFENGEPALAVRYAGRGRLVAFAGSWSLEHTSLMREPICVPFIHELLAALQPETSANAVTVVPSAMEVTLGRRVESSDWIRIDPPLEARVVSPPVQDDASTSVLRVDLVAVPGPVRVFLRGTDDLIGLGSATIDGRESDIRSLSASEIRTRVNAASGDESSGKEIMRTESAVTRATPFESRPRTTPLWALALFVALLGIVAEQFVLWFARSPRMDAHP